MIQIAIIGIVAVFLAMELKSVKPEYSTYIAIGAGILIFFYTLTKLQQIVEAINQIQSYIKINSSYLSALIKIIGITYVSEFASNICKDAGHSTIGGQIEIFAKLTILSLSMPIVLALLETLNNFLS
ncbi:MAG: stage III sporulation protein AD [Lachnospiraceae bacterium]